MKAKSEKEFREPAHCVGLSTWLLVLATCQSACAAASSGHGRPVEAGAAEEEKKDRACLAWVGSVPRLTRILLISTVHILRAYADRC